MEARGHPPAAAPRRVPDRLLGHRELLADDETQLGAEGDVGGRLQVIHFADAFIQSDLQVVHTIET